MNVKYIDLKSKLFNRIESFKSNSLYQLSINTFAPCDTLCESLYRLTYKQQYLKNFESNHCFYRTFYKDHSISFLMISRLMDFALVVLWLLVFKVCGIMGISKVVLFNFFGTERVKFRKTHITLLV